MPRARVSEHIELEYEIIGDAGAEPLMLVMGFSLQMISWDEVFCRMLAEKGYRVVRFDNRDVGLSSRLSHLGLPDFGRAMLGDRTAAVYAIEDMAEDLAGLMTALDMPSAHVVGASMGGFIVQELAIRHGARVRSMCSIMSSTGNRLVGQPRAEALAALMMPPASDRASALDLAVKIWRTIGSPGFPLDEQRIRRRAGDSWDRGHDPAGVARQAAAVFTQRDRTADLRGVKAPALVVHGAEDPLITLSGGQATAEAIPGARLHVVPGMGHDLPEAAWPQVVDAIVDNARRAVA
jgi:pimeloyl-ACP methyl ester carboxylesterase